MTVSELEERLSDREYTLWGKYFQRLGDEQIEAS